MNKEKEQGLFWLPSDPQEKIEGEITTGNDLRTVLTVHGRMGQPQTNLTQTDAIHGVIRGDHIKLVNCLRSNHELYTEGFIEREQSTWKCQFAFQGDEYAGDIPKRIKSVDVKIELLGEWVTGFEGIHTSEDRTSLSWPPSQPDQSAMRKLRDLREDVALIGRILQERRTKSGQKAETPGGKR